jgi:hypothetical protein
MQATIFFGKNCSCVQAACSCVQLRQAGRGFLAERLVMFSPRNDPKCVNSFCENFLAKAGEVMRRAAKAATRILGPVKKAGKQAL